MVDPHVSPQEKNVHLSQKLNQMSKLEDINWVQKSKQAWTQLVIRIMLFPNFNFN